PRVVRHPPRGGRVAACVFEEGRVTPLGPSHDLPAGMDASGQVEVTTGLVLHLAPPTTFRPTTRAATTAMEGDGRGPIVGIVACFLLIPRRGPPSPWLPQTVPGPLAPPRSLHCAPLALRCVPLPVPARRAAWSGRLRATGRGDGPRGEE